MRFTNPARVNWYIIALSLFTVVIFLGGYYFSDFDVMFQLGMFFGLAGISSELISAWTKIDPDAKNSGAIIFIRLIAIFFRITLLIVLSYDLYRPVAVSDTAHTVALVMTIIYGLVGLEVGIDLLSFTRQDRLRQKSAGEVGPFISN